MYLEVDNRMPDSENKGGKKDIESLIKKLGEISEVKDDKKNYIIDIRPEEQAATIIDLKMKVVVDVIIEDNIVKITSGITDDINKVLPPTIKLSYDPKEPNTPIVTITIIAEEENMGIAKIQFPDNTEKTYSNKKRVEVQYPVSENGLCKFVVVGANGRRATETIDIKNIKETAQIVMEPDIKTATKNDVNIKITYDENPAYKGALLTNEDRYQYRIGDNGEWITVTENEKTISIAENGIVHTRYYNGTETIKPNSYTVANIDKGKPDEFNLEVIVVADNITVSGSTTDKGSFGTAPEHIGIQGYQFQLKNNDETVKVKWTPIQIENSYTFTEAIHGVETGTTYKVSMKAIDFAGNEIEALNADESITTENVPKPVANIVKVGDYVNYNPGVWTNDDFALIRASSGSPTVKGTTAAPTVQGQFGGFAVGQNRNINAGGWRVWNVNKSTGEVTIISAKNPESYYLGFKDGYGTASFNILKNRNCSMYENEYAKVGSAHILTGQEAVAWYNKQFGTNYSMFDFGTTGSTFSGITMTTVEPVSVLKNGLTFYFATPYSQYYLYGVVGTRVLNPTYRCTAESES